VVGKLVGKWYLWTEFMKDAPESPDIPTMMKKWDDLVNWKHVKGPHYPSFEECKIWVSN
tara:strand:+ start:172 stop:348 length:177 start_codon:yes stop_codon:yes gene_type:complete